MVLYQTIGMKEAGNKATSRQVEGQERHTSRWVRPPVRSPLISKEGTQAVASAEFNAGTQQCVSKQPVLLPGPPSCHTQHSCRGSRHSLRFLCSFGFLFASGDSAPGNPSQGLGARESSAALQMLC